MYILEGDLRDAVLSSIESHESGIISSESDTNSLILDSKSEEFELNIKIDNENGEKMKENEKNQVIKDEINMDKLIIKRDTPDANSDEDVYISKDTWVNLNKCEICGKIFQVFM